VLAVEGFTLGWIHSIEKIRWEEDWHIEAAMRWSSPRRASVAPAPAWSRRPAAY
jgi:hypothetical protein